MIPKSVKNAAPPTIIPGPGPNVMQIAADEPGQPSVRFTKNPGVISVASEFKGGGRIGKFATPIYIEFPEFIDADGTLVRRAKSKSDPTPISDKMVALRWASVTSFIAQVNGITFDEAKDALAALSEIEDEEEQRAATLHLFGGKGEGSTYYAMTSISQVDDKNDPTRQWDRLNIRYVLSPEQYDAEVKKAEIARLSASTAGGRGSNAGSNKQADTSNTSTAQKPDFAGDEDIPF